MGSIDMIKPLSTVLSCALNKSRQHQEKKSQREKFLGMLRIEPGTTAGERNPLRPLCRVICFEEPAERAWKCCTIVVQKCQKEWLLFTLTVMMAWLHKQKLKRLQKKDQIVLPDLEARLGPSSTQRLSPRVQLSHCVGLFIIRKRAQSYNTNSCILRTSFKVG